MEPITSEAPIGIEVENVEVTPENLRLMDNTGDGFFRFPYIDKIYLRTNLSTSTIYTTDL
jgi:hypothetical protein